MTGRTSFGLKLQNLQSAGDRVLVAGNAVGARNGTGWFEPKEILAFFRLLKVPAPSNVNEALSRLRRKELMVKAAIGPRWALSPNGQLEVAKRLGGVDPGSIDSELIGTPGSKFGHALHTVIGPSFAPAKWTPGISRLLEQYPFESNVFLMTRFPNGPSGHGQPDPVDRVVPAIRTALGKHGLTLHLASDRQIDDDLLGNVAAHLWACQYGVGILEDRVGRGLNYNVITEIGAMLMTGRRCALLKDTTAPRLPTDLGGLLYKSVSLDDEAEIGRLCHSWAADDLNLGRCNSCP